MNYELILGIVGSVTGVVALLIQLFDFRSYIPKLKFKIDKDRCYVFDKSDIELERYRTEKFCLIPLQIDNVSAMPTTITAVSLNNPSKTQAPFPHDAQMRIPQPNISIGENTFITIDIPKTMDLPIRINAYDSLYLSFRFPFMPDSNSVTLCLETPTKNYSLKVALTEFHTVLDRYQSQELRWLL